MSNVKKFILVLCLLSCRESKRNETKQGIDPLAAKFRSIDSKLKDFAGRHNAKVETVWAKLFRSNPGDTETFAVKHIVWSDGDFGKAIVIEPYKDTMGVDSTAWDFLNVAWLDTSLASKPTYAKDLLKKVKFEVIEKNIDQLLSTSEQNLLKIKREDLE